MKHGAARLLVALSPPGSIPLLLSSPPLRSFHAGQKDISAGIKKRKKKEFLLDESVFSVLFQLPGCSEMILVNWFNIRDGFDKPNQSVWIHPPGRCGRAGGGLRTGEGFKQAGAG